MQESEKIVIAWCDNGMVHGQFAHSLSNLLIDNDNVVEIIRSGGKNINLQRQEVLDFWMQKDFDDTDWLLWIDSDIEFSKENFEELINSADKDNFPVVSGFYYLIMNKDDSGVLIPQLSFFADNDENLEGMKRVTSTGFGMILMHRDVIRKLYKDFHNKHLFNKSQETRYDLLIGEDVYFCSHLNAIDIPIYVNCNVSLKHHKTYCLDENYSKLYWSKK